MPSSRQARMIRMAISPRLATRILLNIRENVVLNQTKQGLVFRSEPMDLATMHFNKAGRVQYIPWDRTGFPAHVPSDESSPPLSEFIESSRARAADHEKSLDPQPEPSCAS